MQDDVRDDVAALRARLVAASNRVRHPAVPLHVFVADLVDDEDYRDDGSWAVPEWDREFAHARRGALMMAAERIVEECLHDFQCLAFDIGGAIDRDWCDEYDDVDYTFVYRWFPRRHRAAYDERFFRDVLITAVKVAHDLANPRGEYYAGCVAEEMVRYAVCRYARSLWEEAELAPPLVGPDEALLEDFDFEFLYDSQMDGIETDQTLQVSLGIHIPDVPDWFAPFNDERLVHPLVETSRTATYTMHDLQRRLPEELEYFEVAARAEVVDAPTPLTGIGAISDVVAIARRTTNREIPGAWVADDADPEGSFAALLRATTLSPHGSGWLSWEPHEQADVVRTDQVITFRPHRHFPVGEDEPWAETAIGAGGLLAIPLSAVVSYWPDPDVHRRWNETFALRDKQD